MNKAHRKAMSEEIKAAFCLQQAQDSAIYRMKFVVCSYFSDEQWEIDPVRCVLQGLREMHQNHQNGIENCINRLKNIVDRHKTKVLEELN